VPYFVLLAITKNEDRMSDSLALLRVAEDNGPACIDLLLDFRIGKVVDRLR